MPEVPPGPVELLARRVQDHAHGAKRRGDGLGRKEGAHQRSELWVSEIVGVLAIRKADEPDVSVGGEQVAKLDRRLQTRVVAIEKEYDTGDLAEQPALVPG